MRFVKTRGNGCGVAALAMVAGTSYARALAAVRASGADPAHGLHNREIVAAALVLGLVLEATRARPADAAALADRAILMVSWNARSPYRHAVAVDRGVVLDPDDDPRAIRLDVRDYLRINNARPGTVFAVAAQVRP